MKMKQDQKKSASPGIAIGHQSTVDQDQQAVGQCPRLGAIVDDDKRSRSCRAHRCAGVVEH